MRNKTIIKKTAIICGWLLIWQAAALLAHIPLFFPGPFEVAKELILKLKDSSFITAVFSSYIRILAGLFIATLLSYPAAFLSYRFKLIEELLSVPAAFLKSVPVAAVVVLLLIWSGSSHLVYYITFMVVFPNVYGNLLSGLKKTDRNMLEMADVFNIPFFKRLRCIYRPAYLPYLKSAMSFSIGMSFKSGVAAEIIGLPDHSIGTGIYMDKIYLNTAGVFAWVIVILLLGFVSEKLILFAIDAFPMPKAHNNKTGHEHADAPGHIRAIKINKSYDGKKVLNDVDTDIPAGSCVCLMGASGIGKTTLLKIISGLIKPDSGSVSLQKTGMCFQEDRLWEDADAAVNLWLAGCEGDLPAELKQLLPEETLNTPVKNLSGGEKRRIAVARALLSPSAQILLDEPFTGLDKDTRQKMISWILEKQNGRPMLVVSHDEEDAVLLKAKIISL